MFPAYWRHFFTPQRYRKKHSKDHFLQENSFVFCHSKENISGIKQGDGRVISEQFINTLEVSLTVQWKEHIITTGIVYI